MSMRTGISGWSSLASAKFYEYYPQSFGYLGKICIYLFHELLLLLFFFFEKNSHLLQENPMVVCIL